MAHKNYTKELTKLLLHCMLQEDPMLEMLQWLCNELMEAEVSNQLGAEKSEHTAQRKSHRSGYRPRRLDTRMGTMYLLVPKVRKGGYIPFFITERKRSEAALISVVQEAYIQGVSTRRMEKLAQSLGIESLSAGQVSAMTRGLNEQVEAFRNRDLSGQPYPFLWVDALYEKIRQDGRVISMAILVVCGVNGEGFREVLAAEPMMEESKETYKQLFTALKARGLTGVQLVVSDAHPGLREAIKESFPAASWQRCKVHFMRNIMAHVPHHEKETFAAQLKQIWLAPNRDIALQRAESLINTYCKRFPKAIETLENGLDDSFQFFAFNQIDPRKISSTNLMERLNREVRRRTNVVGIFPHADAYLRLTTAFLMEYAEDWPTARNYIKKDAIQKLLAA